MVIAGISLAIVIGLIYVLVPMAPGWEGVQKSFFNWNVLEKTFPAMLSAFVLDLQLFFISTPLIFMLALIIALMRNVTSAALYPLKLFAIVYIDVLRSIPVILTRSAPKSFAMRFISRDSSAPSRSSTCTGATGVSFSIAA